MPRASWSTSIPENRRAISEDIGRSPISSTRYPMSVRNSSAGRYSSSVDPDRT